LKVGKVSISGLLGLPYVDFIYRDKPLGDLFFFFITTWG
jgi:hypothetical protein